MSLLNKLFGSQYPKNVDVTADSVWLTRDAKYAGIARELAQLSGGDRVAILLVAHFADTLHQLQAIAEHYKGDTPVMAVLASELASSVANRFPTVENQVLDLMIAERHPLTSVDDQMLSGFAESLPCQCRVMYHLSLDEPIMQAFVGARVTEMIGALGFGENEKIESGMVAKRIRAAQQKLTEKATGNRNAESMEEWFKLNLP